MTNHKPPPATKALGIVDGLFQLSFRLQGTLARIAAEQGLSIIQVRLLGILRDREPAMLELASYLELEKSSLSGLVDRAETRGLVERIPSSHDRRIANVRMTAQGRKLAGVIESAVRAEVAKMVGVLSGSEREQLGDLASRVVAGKVGCGGSATMDDALC